MKHILIAIAITMVAGASIYNAMLNPSLIAYILATTLTGMTIMFSVTSGILLAKWLEG